MAGLIKILKKSEKSTEKKSEKSTEKKSGKSSE